MLRDGATSERLEEIDRLLEPPRSMRVNGAPAWYGDDEDAWQQFSNEMRKKA